MDRRQFLKVSATATAVTAAGRAPAFAQGTALHLLQWSHFVPAADTLFEAAGREFGKQAGVEIAHRADQPERHPGPRDGGRAERQPAPTSSSSPTTTRSSTRTRWWTSATWPRRSAASRAAGTTTRKVNCMAGQPLGGRAAVHHLVGGQLPRGLAPEAGLEYPKTWDDFRRAGRAMKAKGKPFGQAFGHSINDPNNWCYPLVWMWGGMEVEKDGRTVVLDCKATVDAIKFNNVLWKECFDEGGLAWDDSNNNRSFLSRTSRSPATRPASTWPRESKYPDVARGTNHGHFPSGPAGRFYWLPTYNSCVMKYSQDQTAWPRTSSATTWTAPSTTSTSRSWTPSAFRGPGPTTTTRCGRRPQDHGVPGDAPVRPPGRPRRPAGPQGHRGADQVHHRRHVRQGHPGPGSRGGGPWATGELKKIYGG